MERFAERLRDAEEELAREVKEQQERWHYQVHRGRVWFDKELEDTHRQLKQSIPDYVREHSILTVLTAPVIYSLIVPLVILDIWTTVYQWVCFPIYGVPRVPRSKYFVIDRQKLAYLNAIEKANCMFCGYANGLLAYVGEVAARTEEYWCPIKHAHVTPGVHHRYHLFFDYGDAAGYRRGLAGLRQQLRQEGDPNAGGRDHPLEDDRQS